VYVQAVTSDPLDVRFELRVSKAWLALVDDWRRQQQDIPARAEAVRRLVELALQIGDRKPFHILLEAFYAEGGPDRIQRMGFDDHRSPAQAAEADLAERRQSTMLYPFEQILEIVSEEQGPATDALRARLRLLLGDVKPRSILPPDSAAR
jgi:hypothetical protein